MSDLSSARPPLPPGRGYLPWVGEFWRFIADIHGFVLSRKARWGDIYWARVYLRNTVFVTTPAANTWVFRGEHRYLRKNWPTGWKKLAGRNAQAVVVDADHHTRQMAVMRKILTPTDEMIELFTTHVRAHLREWASREFIEPAVDVKLMALQIDCAALLGLELDRARCRWVLDNFAELVTGFSCFLPLDIPGCPFHEAMGARRRLQAFFEQVIRTQQAEPELGEHPLGRLLAHAREQGIELAELKDQFQILIFAGHEFTGAGMIGACLELTRNPEIFARVAAELREWGDRELNREALAELPLLDAFVKEVLRTYPPVPGGYRELTEEVEFGGYRLPRGWFVKFEPFLCHFDERYWTEPNRFDPDRFLPPRCEHKANPMAYIPFGGGRRACPGGRYSVLLMKIFVAEIVRGYELIFHGTPTLESKFGHLYQPRFDLSVTAGTCVRRAHT